MTIISGAVTDKYKLGAPLEMDYYNNIYLIETASDEIPLCCKRIRYDGMLRKTKEKINNAIHVLVSLNHQNIAKCIEIFKSSNEVGCDIVMYYYKHGNLQNFLAGHRAREITINEDLLWIMMVQILVALDYCHSPVNNPMGKAIVHGNINPENIFLGDDGHIKLAVFDARCFYEDNPESQSILPLKLSSYMAPEMLGAKIYTDRVDVWSIGCIMYELATHKRVIEGDCIKEQLKSARNAAAVVLQISSCSPEYCKVVSKMLTYDPTNRPTVAEVLGYQEVLTKIKQWRASGVHYGHSSTNNSGTMPLTI